MKLCKPKSISRKFWSKIPELKKFFPEKFHNTVLEWNRFSEDGCIIRKHKTLKCVSVTFGLNCKYEFNREFDYNLEKLTDIFKDLYYNGEIYRGLLSPPMIIQEEGKLKYHLMVYVLGTGFEEEINKFSTKIHS